MRSSLTLTFILDQMGPGSPLVKATELRCKVAGLLVDRLFVETVDLRGALDAARRRARIVNPSLIEDHYDPFERMP